MHGGVGKPLLELGVLSHELLDLLKHPLTSSLRTNALSPGKKGTPAHLTVADAAG
jgi:hypothetical protein